MLGGRGAPSLRRPACGGRATLHIARATLTVEAPKKALGAVELPPALQKSVVVLDAPNANGSTTKVYVMGVSHVSKVQAEQVKELIRAVRPEVVMVELCKDRVGLLVDERPETWASNLWHCRKVSIEGLPTEPEWPTAEQLKPLLNTRSGRPVTTQDIEADVYMLLSTGLFKSGRPGAEKSTLDDAPEFAVSLDASGEVQLQTIPPLKAIKFVVAPRELAPVTELTVRIDSSLKAQNPDPAKLAAVGEAVVAEVKDGVAPLLSLLRSKQRFADAVGCPVAVAFTGVETGRVEAIVKAVKASDRPYVSGFEASAVNGEGWGIDPFRPSRPLHKLSDKMFLTTPTLEAMRAKARSAADVAAGAAAAARRAAVLADAQPRSAFRVWSDEELAAAKRCDPEPVPLADGLATILTLLYGKLQAEVGFKAGAERGAAWRAALAAASEVGAQQLVLSDRPSIVTDRRLADGLMGAGAALRIGGAAGVLLSTIVATLFTSAPLEAEAGAVGASILASFACLWPLVQPFLDLRRLLAMSPEEIEEAVRVKEPLGANVASGKLFGEDALLDWPGADGPLLQERDEFMARAAASAAAGADHGVCPAYVFDRIDGQLVWRLMQAEGAPAEACPPGYGDGAYRPLADVRSVVSIVGTVHVQGIARRWGAAVQAPGDVQALLSDPNKKPEVDSSSSSSGDTPAAS